MDSLARGSSKAGAVRRAGLAVSLAAVALTGVVTAPLPADADALYRSHHWFELRSALTARSSPLLRAAVASAFNDPTEAERLLRDVIRADPRSTHADDAYDLLLRIYLRSGQYARLLNAFREWHQSNPESAQLRAQQSDVDKVSGRPDQIARPSHPATLHHDPGSFSIPVTIDGKTDDFLMDTGAWTSVLTDREARKLGVSVGQETRTMTGGSGGGVQFRTAIVKDVVVGATTFHDVSFAVLDPTGPLGDAEGGIVGMPILLGLGTIRWSKSGTVEVGRTETRANTREPNLVFDRNRILLRSQVLGETVLAVFDTGADATDLNANFATRFAPLIERSGKRTTHELIGADGSKTVDSMELPEVAFVIGGMRALLRPAHVTLQRIEILGGECCIGNIGRDVVAQGRELTIDLSVMTLALK